MTTVHRARADQIPALARALAAAFVDDPILRWPFPHLDDDPEGRARQLFEILLASYVAADVAWTTEDASGVAVWVPPTHLDVFTQMEAATRPAIARLTDDGGARYAAFWDWLGDHATGEPAWFLDILGVDPARQGEGIGRALIEAGLAAVRADAMPAVLETANPRNVAYYERFGFELAEERDAPGGGPHVWFMRRPA